ncbi:MAG: efflux RND transporter periplasmic adaptor subunit [Phreatobacter sp.]
MRFQPSRMMMPIAFSLSLALVGCKDGQQAQGHAMPPAPVAVFTTVSEDIPITNELPGRIAPTRIAQVRPRVSGIVVERVFQQGTAVNEGDVLYRIDPAPFRVEVERAQATLQRAEATRVQAQQQAERYEQLRARNVASPQQYESAVASLAQADADVASGKAGLAAAQLNLQYTNITAPIRGRTGRALVTEGALVAANGAEPMTIIQQLDPVYADFTQSATDLVRLRRALQAGALTATGQDEARVRLLLDDGSLYPHPGRLLFSEATVDTTTGQVTLRGEFPNPNGDLLPGLYVRVQIEQGVQRGAIAIPQQAIQRDNAGRAQVYVVKEDDTTELRTVTTNRVVNGRSVINEGLKPGERVVVDGFQRLRPGAKVKATAWVPPAQTSAAASTSTVQ